MLRIYDIQKSVDAQECRLSAKIDCPQAQWQEAVLWFSFPLAYADRVTRRSNPFLAGVLFSAMTLRQDIHIEGVVSRKLLRGTEILMDIYRQWFPQFYRINVTADHVDESGYSVGQYNGSFFSGGVDSFYTVLKNMNTEDPEFKITHLIFAQGLDIPLENQNGYTAALEHIRQISDNLGLELIAIKTNVRQLNESLLDWHETHGAALAAIGLCLEPLFAAVFISSEHTYQYLTLRGTHPLTDPLWSTESLRFIHDGSEADRVEKVRAQIARSRVALDHLRVCWQNVEGQYNCGRCEKCLRTKINLYLAGVLDQCRTFDDVEIDARRIASLTIRDEYVLDFAMQNYNALSRTEADSIITSALKKAIQSYDVYHRRKKRKELKRRIRSKIKNTVYSVLNGITGSKRSR